MHYQIRETRRYIESQSLRYVSDVALGIGQDPKPFRQRVIVGVILWPLAFDIEDRSAIEKVQAFYVNTISFALDQPHQGPIPLRPS
jgi:hypothetical protein